MAAMRRRLADLFPPSSVTPRTATRVLAVVAVLIVGVAVSLLRQAGAPPTDTLWAEDGKEFLADAVADGPVAVVFRPYNYLHLAPRLVAVLAMVFPIGWAAVVFAVAGAALIVGCGIFVFVASRQLVPSPAVRGLLAAWFVLLPTAAYETMNQVTNLHWYLFVVAFWALLWRPQSSAGLITGVVAVVLAGLSNPVTLLLAPIAVARLAADLPIRDRIVPALLLVLGAVQAVVMLGPGSAAAGDRPELDALVEVTANRFAGGTLLGHQLHGDLYATFGMGVAVVAVLVLCTLLAALVRHWRRPQGILGAFALLLAPALFASLVYVRGSAAPLQWTAEYQGIAGARYTVGAALLVASAAALLAGVVAPRPVLGWTLVGLLLVPALVDFRPLNDRSLGPRWSEEIAVATAQCAEEDAPPFVAPRYPPGWDLPVPCSMLREG